MSYTFKPARHEFDALIHAFDALPRAHYALEPENGKAGVVINDHITRVVREFYESYEQGDLDRTWERYMARDMINHAFDGAYDRDAWREVDKTFVAAFPNLQVQVLDQAAAGDKVATWYTFTGTQSAEYLGIPASGVTATLSATSWDRITDGRIVEHWATADVAGFMQQLRAAGEH